MPRLLWGGGLLLGILMLLVRMPVRAPPFESLTQYTCDRLPNLPSLGYRQSYQLNLRCRAGDVVVTQRGFPAYDNNPSWSACRRGGGLIRIWRVAGPNPYGAYVFHATCDDHVITYYRARVVSYELSQQFVIAIACILILIGAIGFARNQVKNCRPRANKERP